MSYFSRGRGAAWESNYGWKKRHGNSEELLFTLKGSRKPIQGKFENDTVFSNIPQMIIYDVMSYSAYCEITVMA